jgi:hypothetical protein
MDCRYAAGELVLYEEMHDSAAEFSAVAAGADDCDMARVQHVSDRFGDEGHSVGSLLEPHGIKHGHARRQVAFFIIRTLSIEEQSWRKWP